MNCRIGVCSWSLQPSSPADLAQKVRSCGLDWVQLALDPLRTGSWKVDETRHELDKQGIRVLSGMMAMKGEDYATLDSIRVTGGVRPDEHFEANLAAARDNAAIARDLGLSLVSFHAGFIPERNADPERAKILDRIREIVDVFGEAGVRVALETGQESEGGMSRALLDLRRPGAGVNF
jgi:L-ribulose-5-phosphate 3-epimerase